MSDSIATPADLSETLRAARKDRGLTQSAAAKAAGISRQHLSEIESARAINIELPTLLRLLASYGLSMRIEPESPRPTLNQILRERERERGT